MRIRELSYVVVFLLIVIVAVACTPSATSQQASKETNTKETPAAETAKPADNTATPEAAPAIPQLDEEGREDSATMVLLNTPPTQPADHVDRWNPEQRQDSCLACHATPATGAPTPPADHYYDNKQGGTIFRDNCIQCHAQQNDTKPAFNREK